MDGRRRALLSVPFGYASLHCEQGTPIPLANDLQLFNFRWQSLFKFGWQWTIVHYPIMYIFYKWLIEKHLYTFGETWWISLIVIAASVILASICLKLYDEPVRRLLAKKFLRK